ncbi:glycoside hydrolase superfamily [Rhizoctonia solani]|nr:glycoside hydrolase superfamily [Rhizoctonia solani]
MRLGSLALGAGLLGATSVAAAQKGLPVDKVYGVNLGSWLLSEPWMFPKEWVEKMGGDSCDDCSKCAASEFDLVKKLGQDRADQVFKELKDVNDIADAGLNTVRIPLGYWIIEDLVDRNSEYYPRGGLEYLKKGLRMLKQKGIHVLLDFHAMPGVAAINQMFAGRCTADVQFYTDENYERALTWAAVMTRMTYQDPDFSTVFAIEAVNEPVMDASKTPGYGDYQRRFVQVVRSVENELEVQCQNLDPTKVIPNPSSADADEAILKRVLEKSASMMKNILSQHGSDPSHPSSGIKLPITLGDDEIAAIRLGHGAGRLPLPMVHLVQPLSNTRITPGILYLMRLAWSGTVLTGVITANAFCCPWMVADWWICGFRFMNKDWQFNNPPNPADAANGPQLYDAHLYFSFGGVAEPNADSYMRTICNTDRVQKAYEQNNNPLVFGEWSLATNFDNSEEFLYDWADAQRHIYAGQADGWIFWSWKIEEGSPYVTQWSYSNAVKTGYFKKDPSQLTNPNVCGPWIANSNSTST